MNPSLIDESRNFSKVAKSHSCLIGSPHSLGFDVNQNPTNYLGCYTQFQPSDTGINKFLESKTEAFDFAPVFETNCLNIIEPDSIGFQEIENSKFLLNKDTLSDKQSPKDEHDLSSSQSSSQFNLSLVLRRGSLNSEEMYNDDCLSQPFSSGIDD